jgi:ribosome-binding factor A
LKDAWSITSAHLRAAQAPVEQLALSGASVEARSDQRKYPLICTRIACDEIHMARDRHSRTEVSQRQLRVGELVRHALADLLTRGDVHDPVMESHVITIPEVRMSSDLRLATIYVMPLGGQDIDAVLAAFRRNKRFLRGEIARRVNLKFAPDIRFSVDERFAAAERIDELLRRPQVRRDLDGKVDDGN